MASRLGEFLATNKIDPRRIVVASKRIECLRREDRAIRLAERKARKSDEQVAKTEAPKRTKPRSGRPVTQRSLDTALQGGPLTGPQKTRILRAVNRILEQKKLPLVDLRSLF